MKTYRMILCKSVVPLTFLCWVLMVPVYSQSNCEDPQLLKDINPGVFDASLPIYFAGLNGKLFFADDDGVNGIELWVTDGTEAGTELFTDINPTGSSRPTYLATIGNRIFFWQTMATLEENPG